MKRITSYSTDESARERTSVSTLCKQLSSKFREINIRQFPSTRFGANENVNENEQSEKEGAERQSEKERERNRKCHWTHLWFGSGICLCCSLYLLFWLCSVWCSFFHIVGGVVHYFITVFFSLSFAAAWSCIFQKQAESIKKCWKKISSFIPWKKRREAKAINSLTERKTDVY